ncbi:hypothetical protein ACK6D9_21040 [Hoeflea sp. Naph1]|uniref:hypothetical protein n=1 Tax=Hoeflea sp. Naph1 TaxID=3388653 RepID=UPI00398FC793
MPKDKRNPTIRAMLAREIRNTQKNARAGADTLLFMTNATAAIVAKALTNHARGRLIMLDIRCVRRAGFCRTFDSAEKISCSYISNPVRKMKQLSMFVLCGCAVDIVAGALCFAASIFFYTAIGVL